MLTGDRTRSNRFKRQPVRFKLDIWKNFLNMKVIKYYRAIQLVACRLLSGHHSPHGSSCSVVCLSLPASASCPAPGGQALWWKKGQGGDSVACALCTARKREAEAQWAWLGLIGLACTARSKALLHAPLGAEWGCPDRMHGWKQGQEQIWGDRGAVWVAYGEQGEWAACTAGVNPNGTRPVVCSPCLCQSGVCSLQDVCHLTSPQKLDSPEVLKQIKEIVEVPTLHAFTHRLNKHLSGIA